MSELIQEQEPPQNSSGDCWLLVLEDMRERHQHGIDKYGKPVQPGNGRKALTDAYQEALDLVVYLRQEMEERKRLEAENADLKARLAAAYERIAKQSDRLSRNAEKSSSK